MFVVCGCNPKHDMKFQRDFSNFLKVLESEQGFRYLINNSTNHGLEKIQILYGSNIYSSTGYFLERVHLSFSEYDIRYSQCRTHVFSYKGDTLIFLKVKNRWLYDDLKINYSYNP